MQEVKLYQCPVCGFHYRNEMTAKECEAWCREHKSCNIEIIAHAIENDPPAPTCASPTAPARRGLRRAGKK